MIWLHYLIAGITIPLLLGTIIFVLRTSFEVIGPLLKGVLLGILLPFLIFNIVAMFHVEEMIWDF